MAATVTENSPFYKKKGKNYFKKSCEVPIAEFFY
jgi:hypothetical protein